MLNVHVADILVSPQATILDAIKAMERPPKKVKPAGIVLVVENGGTPVGVVTDGDIRRAILANVGLDQAEQETQ